MTQTKLELVKCDACGIRIGQGFIETYSSLIGDNKLCGRCYGVLLKCGRVEMGGSRRGSWLGWKWLSNETALYLHQDGTKTKELVLLDK